MWSVCGCVSLNLSPLHTPQPCARVATRVEAASAGVRELGAGPVEVWEEPTGGGTASNRKSFPPCAAGLQTMNNISYTDTRRRIFLS